MAFTLSSQGRTQSPLSLDHSRGQVTPGPFFLHQLISSDRQHCISRLLCFRNANTPIMKILGNLHRLDNGYLNSTMQISPLTRQRGAGLLLTEQWGPACIRVSFPVVVTVSAIPISLFSFHRAPIPWLVFVLCFFQILLDGLEHRILHQPLTEPYQFSIIGLTSILITDFFLLSWERKAAELAHGTGVLPPSRCSPRAPQRATAVYPTVCEHTLPLPRRGAGAARGARRADAQDARRPTAETEAEEGGTGCSEQKGSTSPGSSPTPPLLPLRDWLSGKQVAICSPNSHKTGSSDPGRKATCAMRIRGCVFKKGNREETTRSPFSCRQIR